MPSRLVQCEDLRVTAGTLAAIQSDLLIGTTPYATRSVKRDGFESSSPVWSSLGSARSVYGSYGPPGLGRTGRSHPQDMPIFRKEMLVGSFDNFGSFRGSLSPPPSSPGSSASASRPPTPLSASSPYASSPSLLSARSSSSSSLSLRALTPLKPGVVTTTRSSSTQAAATLSSKLSARRVRETHSDESLQQLKVFPVKPPQPSTPGRTSRSRPHLGGGMIRTPRPSTPQLFSPSPKRGFPVHFDAAAAEYTTLMRPPSSLSSPSASSLFAASSPSMRRPALPPGTLVSAKPAARGEENSSAPCSQPPSPLPTTKTPRPTTAPNSPAQLASLAEPPPASPTAATLVGATTPPRSVSRPKSSGPYASVTPRYLNWYNGSFDPRGMHPQTGNVLKRERAFGQHCVAMAF